MYNSTGEFILGKAHPYCATDRITCPGALDGAKSSTKGVRCSLKSNVCYQYLSSLGFILASPAGLATSQSLLDGFKLVSINKPFV